MTQTETIVWHKYSDDCPLPKDRCLYLVDYGYLIDVVYWLGALFAHNDQVILAWAELPKGWKDE